MSFPLGTCNQPQFQLIVLGYTSQFIKIAQNDCQKIVGFSIQISTNSTQSLLKLVKCQEFPYFIQSIHNIGKIYWVQKIGMRLPAKYQEKQIRRKIKKQNIYNIIKNKNYLSAQQSYSEIILRPPITTKSSGDPTSIAKRMMELVVLLKSIWNGPTLYPQVIFCTSSSPSSFTRSYFSFLAAKLFNSKIIITKDFILYNYNPQITYLLLSYLFCAVSSSWRHHRRILIYQNWQIKQIVDYFLSIFYFQLFNLDQQLIKGPTTYYFAYIRGILTDTLSFKRNCKIY